jgi:hypothetical protein
MGAPKQNFLDGNSSFQLWKAIPWLEKKRLFLKLLPKKHSKDTRNFYNGTIYRGLVVSSMSVDFGNFLVMCFLFRSGESCGNKNSKIAAQKRGNPKNHLCVLCGKPGKPLRKNLLS